MDKNTLAWSYTSAASLPVPPVSAMPLLPGSQVTAAPQPSGDACTPTCPSAPPSSGHPRLYKHLGAEPSVSEEAGAGSGHSGGAGVQDEGEPGVGDSGAGAQGWRQCAAPVEHCHLQHCQQHCMAAGTTAPCHCSVPVHRQNNNHPRPVWCRHGDGAHKPWAGPQQHPGFFSAGF